MYKKLWIITIVIITALTGLVILGFFSLSLHRQGLMGRRYAEFTSVAEQIRADMKRKMDRFIHTEQNRKWTDYQYQYIPETTNSQTALLRSPLADKFNNGLAQGYFQIQPTGLIDTPYYSSRQIADAQPQIKQYITNLKNTLLPALTGDGFARKRTVDPENLAKILNQPRQYDYVFSRSSLKTAAKKPVAEDEISQTSSRTARQKSKTAQLKIESLQENKQIQTIEQSRQMVFENQVQNTTPQAASDLKEDSRHDNFIFSNNSGQSVNNTSRLNKRISEEQQEESLMKSRGKDSQKLNYEKTKTQSPPRYGRNTLENNTSVMSGRLADKGTKPQNTVKVRIEPFVPVVIKTTENKILNGQVYLLRHVTIEQTHLIQGFKLNQNQLLEELTQSADQLIRAGMSFEISPRPEPNARHSALLDFGFGSMVINLFEKQNSFIQTQINRLKKWYTAIITLVTLAVLLALVALWYNVARQVELVRKKDDFLSAVSHELRTPLTSIRMYSEMLEKGYVNDQKKLNQYYSNVRSESERLSRLIENVLDFSRIQQGRKKYNFRIGNINDTVEKVVQMMEPCAKQLGFNFQLELSQNLPSANFDPDVISQVLINLIDNAVKYAADAEDKNIIIKTFSKNQRLFIEVRDFGPGIPKTQRKKIFDEFYRIHDESTRKTTGTGLGLALVSKFAQAHKGFAEFIAPKNKGSIFRINIPVA